jgi:uncharacterized RDD family membrane protein YckC
MALMVIRTDGKPLGVLGSAARVIGQLAYLLIIAVGLVIAYLFRERTLVAAIAIGVALFVTVLGILWAVFDGKRRAAHDRIAGTIVVRIQ